MGFAKNQMMEHEDNVNRIMRLAVEAGEMSMCEIHETYTDEMGGHEDTLAAARDEFPDLSHADLEALVEDAFDNAGMGCVACERNMAE